MTDLFRSLLAAAFLIGLAHAASAAVSLTVSPNPAAPASNVAIQITGASGNPDAWVSIEPATAADGSYHNNPWVYIANGSQSAPTSGVTNASVTLKTLNATGSYQVRYYADNGLTVAARIPLTVASASSAGVTSLSGGGIASVNHPTGDVVLTVPAPPIKSVIGTNGVTCSAPDANGTVTCKGPTVVQANSIPAPGTTCNGGVDSEWIYDSLTAPTQMTIATCAAGLNRYFVTNMLPGHMQ